MSLLARQDHESKARPAIDPAEKLFDSGQVAEQGEGLSDVIRVCAGHEWRDKQCDWLIRSACSIAGAVNRRIDSAALSLMMPEQHVRQEALAALGAAYWHYSRWPGDAHRWSSTAAKKEMARMGSCGLARSSNIDQGTWPLTRLFQPR